MNSNVYVPYGERHTRRSFREMTSYFIGKTILDPWQYLTMLDRERRVAIQKQSPQPSPTGNVRLIPAENYMEYNETQSARATKTPKTAIEEIDVALAQDEFILRTAENIRDGTLPEYEEFAAEADMLGLGPGRAYRSAFEHARDMQQLNHKINEFFGNVN